MSFQLSYLSGKICILYLLLIRLPGEGSALSMPVLFFYSVPSLFTLPNRLRAFRILRPSLNPLRHGGSVPSVEECTCPPGHTGTSCERCITGFWRDPSAPAIASNDGTVSTQSGTGYQTWQSTAIYRRACVACNCYGHSGHCYERTGKCLVGETVQ
ncbi:unnamed protein product [Protopolystoma xenopodis]|uniref:EGF-like domain-containing protein n=1 Tax=Protopolystoma xenopodis TaxID=117903 RepID=A0A3S5A547_9PLAT|nr:unnamed protein product [Protopolystoma xenopodis]